MTANEALCKIIEIQKDEHLLSLSPLDMLIEINKIALSVISSPSDNTQSIDKELAGKIWDAAEEFSNECWCGQCDYCNTVSKRPPDKETFINSLNLDNTQIRDEEDDFPMAVQLTND